MRIAPPSRSGSPGPEGLGRLAGRLLDEGRKIGLGGLARHVVDRERAARTEVDGIDDDLGVDGAGRLRLDRELCGGRIERSVDVQGAIGLDGDHIRAGRVLVEAHPRVLAALPDGERADVDLPTLRRADVTAGPGSPRIVRVSVEDHGAAAGHVGDRLAGLGVLGQPAAPQHEDAGPEVDGGAGRRVLVVQDPAAIDAGLEGRGRIAGRRRHAEQAVRDER